MHHLAATAAVLAGLGLRPGRGAAAAAGGAGGVAQDGDLLRHARRRLQERDGDARLDVAAARRPSPAGARGAAEDVAEDVRERREDVAHVAESGAAAEVHPGPGVAEPVVLRALLGIGEDLIGLRRLLEAVLGLGVAWVAVRVQLHRHAAIGALELSGGGVVPLVDRLDEDTELRLLRQQEVDERA